MARRKVRPGDQFPSTAASISGAPNWNAGSSEPQPTFGLRKKKAIGTIHITLRVNEDAMMRRIARMALAFRLENVETEWSEVIRLPGVVQGRAGREARALCDRGMKHPLEQVDAHEPVAGLNGIGDDSVEA